MMVSVPRKELLESVKKLSGATARNKPVKALEGIHMETSEKTGTLMLTATNLEVAIRATMPASVEQGGSLVVNARLLQNMLTLLDGENVHMELLTNVALEIKSGSCAFQIAAIPGKEFPKVEIPLPGDTVTVSGIKTLVRKTAFSASNSKEQSPIFSCVNLLLTKDGLRAVATNGFTMAKTDGDDDCKGDISLLVPASSLKLLASISQDSDVYELGVTGNNGAIKNVVLFDGTLLFSARLMDGKFMDSDKMFDSFNGDCIAVVNSEKLREGLCRIRTMSSSSDRVAIEFNTSELKLSIENENGAASTPVSASVVNADGEPNYYGVAHLSNCIKVLTGDISIKKSDSGALLISDEKGKYLIMNMRAQPVKKDTKKKAAAITKAAA